MARRWLSIRVNLIRGRGQILDPTPGRIFAVPADHGEYPGGYLNTETGEVVPAVATDAYAVGEEYAVDLEEGDWVHLLDDSREGWQDMADFAAAVDDLRTREMLEDALQGKGAFSRFRRAIDRANLAEEWYCFADDRRWGRARQELADLGLRPA